MPDYPATTAHPAWKNILSVTGVTGVVVLIIGLILAALGAWLIVLGGTWYYFIAGLALIADGGFILARRREGFWLYRPILLGTILWALWEVGLDGWQLMPRVFAPAVLGIWISLPFVATRMGVSRRHAWLGTAVCALIALLVVALGYRTSAMDYRRYTEVAETGSPIASDPLVPDGEWRYYGRTADGSRFSPLNDITAQNVSGLKEAWRFRTGDLPRPQDTKGGREFNFEATPVKAGENLYFCTPHRQVIALNATSGKLVWRFDPQNDTSANIFLSCRGVSYYEAPQGTASCPRRIIATTADARMMALDAETGKLCPDFGDGGYVSLTDHMGPVPPGFHFISSQPMIIKGRMILGGWIYDNQAEGEPSGVIRAYDPVTGALAWAWDLGAPDPTAPLKPGQTYTRGTPNGWGTYTADPNLGLVYVPLGNPPPDYYGGNRRRFDDEYSSSLVALDIETGRERWHYQTVHHDLWDFDLPIAGSLIDLPDDSGGTIPAIIQTTKMGELFLLDRRDGHSLAEVKEISVPQEHVAGEYLSPTQPWSTGMPSLAPAKLKETEAWGATPVDQLLCRIDYHRRNYDGMFTPPSLKGNIAYPAFFGVLDWYGAAIDPARKLLVINASYMPMTTKMVPQAKAVKQGLYKPWAGWDSGQPFPQGENIANNPQYGTPYGVIVNPWLNKIEVPCHAPPWGKVVAVDLAARKIVWERPFGTTRTSGPFSIPLHIPFPMGMPSMGGGILTAGGLYFIGATMDNEIRAYDERTGEELWHNDLPAGGQATPATYTGADGRQYVVIAAGGHGGLGTRPGDYVIAYALPQK
jgi:quinoprotein glucose dehydrogenase